MCASTSAAFPAHAGVVVVTTDAELTRLVQRMRAEPHAALVGVSNASFARAWTPPFQGRRLPGPTSAPQRPWPPER